MILIFFLLGNRVGGAWKLIADPPWLAGSYFLILIINGVLAQSCLPAEGNLSGGFCTLLPWQQFCESLIDYWIYWRLWIEGESLWLKTSPRNSLICTCQVLPIVVCTKKLTFGSGSSYDYNVNIIVCILVLL